MKTIFLAIIYISRILMPCKFLANVFIEPTFAYMKNYAENDMSKESSNDLGGILGIGFKKGIDHFN